jgi:hypothetical protein
MSLLVVLYPLECSSGKVLVEYWRIWIFCNINIVAAFGLNLRICVGLHELLEAFGSTEISTSPR